ncbi:MAG: hypothetical protein HY862_08590 [Chloroflexi bacterium]|nr:hypothetical protein [Chloroflexota bacterium]
MSNSLDQMIERLAAIDWSLQADSWNKHPKSLWVLLQEYMARIAHWGERLENPPTHIIFDVVQYIDPEARANYDAIEKLHHLRINDSRFYEAFMMIRLLDWAVLEERQDLAKFELPPPYEPMLRFLERGGWFGGEHGWIEVAYRSFYISSVRWELLAYRALMTDLSDEALDAIDAENEKGG